MNAALKTSLSEFHGGFKAAVDDRNALLHAHPYTAVDGAQQIAKGGREWPVTDLITARRQFEKLAIEGNGIYHGELSKAVPK